MYRFKLDTTLSEAIEHMTDGNIDYISLDNPKVLEVNEHLKQEGYNPYELLHYFAHHYYGGQGLPKLKHINRWTSDQVWVEFVKYKRGVREEAERDYKIELNEIQTYVDNHLSTPLEVLVHKTRFRAAGHVVGIDCAMYWRNLDGADPRIKKFINYFWDDMLITLRALPEYLPYVNNLRNHLLNHGMVYDDGTADI